MKKAFLFLIAAVILGCVAYGIKAKENATIMKKIDDEHIYFFYQERCQHCHHARDYIKQKYPTLAVEYRDVMIQKNVDDFLVCAKKFNLPDNSLGTPLICMGKNVIMGWSEKDQNNFDSYVKPFIK